MASRLRSLRKKLAPGGQKAAPRHRRRCRAAPYRRYRYRRRRSAGAERSPGIRHSNLPAFRVTRDTRSISPIRKAAKWLRQPPRKGCARFAAALAQAGLPPALISGSGTGTYSEDCGRSLHELQVGSYVFMDADYARVVDETGRGPSFEPSLFVLATVVSVNRSARSRWMPGRKRWRRTGRRPATLSASRLAPAIDLPATSMASSAVPGRRDGAALGARLLIGATHCDPTVNLHACYHVVENGDVRRWPICARHGD